jgi:hypothetical protein
MNFENKKIILFRDVLSLIFTSRNTSILCLILAYTLFNIYLIRFVYENIENGYSLMLNKDIYSFLVGLISFSFYFIIYPEHKNGFMKRIFAFNQNKMLIIYKRFILITFLSIISGFFGIICLLFLSNFFQNDLELAKSFVFKLIFSTLFYSSFLFLLYIIFKNFAVSTVTYFLITRFELLIVKNFQEYKHIKFLPFSIFDNSVSFETIIIRAIYFAILIISIVLLWKKNKYWDF